MYFSPRFASTSLLGCPLLSFEYAVASLERSKSERGIDNRSLLSARLAGRAKAVHGREICGY